MTGWHEAGNEWSAESLADSAGCSVSISDGTSTTAPIAAVVGMSRVEEVDDRSFVITSTTTDFIVPTARLLFAGIAKLPAVGWRIVWQRKGFTETYEVRSIQGRGCYTPSGQYRDQLRIFTNLIGQT